MRLELRYPVDRYLVESSKKFEMVNIIDDDIWNTEPTLRPEDEIILRKLHEMLQSTADDLKLLSGELSKFHEPGVQVKSLPTPLDEDFNEKVHIEEVVNAKFHGYKIFDKPTTTFPGIKLQNNMPNAVKSCNHNDLRKIKVVNTGVQVNPAPILKNITQNKNLKMSRTKVIQINENPTDNAADKLNNGKVIKNVPAVAYNEFSFKYVEPKNKNVPKKQLQVQEMPSINIRSELREQKVLNINIIPETDSKVNNTNKSNVTVITMTHEEPKKVPVACNIQPPCPEMSVPKTQPSRKIQKMSTCESSDSTNNISSDAQQKIKTQIQIRDAIMYSPKVTSGLTRVERNRNKSTSQKPVKKPSHLNLDQWKKKLTVVYGPSNTRKNKLSDKEIKRKVSPKKTNLVTTNENKSKSLNNAQYIPYSRLTLGGVRVSDIEKEIADMPNKNDLPLTPILDRILTSRENSFHYDYPKKDSSRILTTSDENLLQEVIDIERTVGKILSKDTKIKTKNTSNLLPNFPVENNDEAIKENDSYDDDFEDDKSEQSVKQLDLHSGTNSSSQIISNKESSNNEDNDKTNVAKSIQNTTLTKISNLSFKNSVDIFEYVHAVNTQDSATQSVTGQKISLKETQTSPRNDERNVQPIHNDLWPTIDPRGDVETLFKLEKDFIKKLIIDEYGDILEKNITKPSTSEDNNKVDTKDKNVAVFQKNTQIHNVKSIMTSPRKTKTRTASPFALSLMADHQTSPLIFVTEEEELKADLENEENLGVSINLSSPRFSLRLPQNSREVISNLDVYSNRFNIKQKRNKPISNLNRKDKANTSSSVDADNSSSEISSLGEVKLKMRRRMKKNRAPISSDSSLTSIMSKYSSDLQSTGILPLRSEGELSIGQTTKKSTNVNKSDGETSVHS